MNKIIIDSIENINNVALQFIELMGNNKLFAFYGEMGTGKTTLIKAICEQLGVTNDIINSPSFSIVNHYITLKGENIYHFDLYRINKIEEVYDIGFEEYLDNFDYCFIEWPRIVKDILPYYTVNVNIKLNNDNTRTVFL